MGDVRGQELDFCPLTDEVGKSLRLNSNVAGTPDVMAHELESPLGDSASDVTITDDLPEWV